MTKVMESDQTKIAVLVEKVGTMSTVLTKLDSKFDSMNDKFAQKDQVILLEKKVELLEDWKNKMLGGLIMIQFVWAIILYYLFGIKH